ncbi:MAG: hypothetical protein ACRDKS_15605 [Actinomycetota bacterium]
MRSFRVSILWLAAIFVVTGAALGSAQVGDKQGADVAAAAKPTSTPAGSGHGADVSELAKQKDQDTQADNRSGERKQNHGFFVSQAAHCEDVDDPNTPESPDFTAPEDCTGSAHGQYVSSVAKSSIGKKDKKSSDADGS